VTATRSPEPQPFIAVPGIADQSCRCTHLFQEISEGRVCNLAQPGAPWKSRKTSAANHN